MPAKLSTTWFGDRERAIATNVGALSIPIGTIIGLSLGPILVDTKRCSTNDADFLDCVEKNRPYLRQSIENLLFI